MSSCEMDKPRMKKIWVGMDNRMRAIYHNQTCLIWERWLKDKYVFKGDSFDWMERWLKAYAKENELDVSKVMKWIFLQDMGC